MNNTNTLFPIFLKQESIRFLIIGGGNVASEKLHFLLKSSPDAQVVVVAPVISDDILEYAERHHNIKLKQRTFKLDDVQNSNLVLVATNNHELNLHVAKISKDHGKPVNVADTPELCDFYLGSIVTKGSLKIGISTNGKSPTFAKRFRQYLEETLPDDLPLVLDQLNEIRNQIQGDFSKKVKELNLLTKGLLEKNLN